VRQRLLTLIVATVAFWVLTAIPVKHLGGGDTALLYSGTALLLCLVPGVLTMLWIGWTTDRDPQQRLLAALGSTGVRLFGVLLAGLLLVRTVPLYREQSGFLIWLLVFYLFTLTLEMVLLLKAGSRPAQSGESAPGS
jgi:hypothetical protein